MELKGSSWTICMPEFQSAASYSIHGPTFQLISFRSSSTAIRDQPSSRLSMLDSKLLVFWDEFLQWTCQFKITQGTLIQTLLLLMKSRLSFKFQNMFHLCFTINWSLTTESLELNELLKKFLNSRLKNRKLTLQRWLLVDVSMKKWHLNRRNHQVSQNQFRRRSLLFLQISNSQRILKWKLQTVRIFSRRMFRKNRITMKRKKRKCRSMKNTRKRNEICSNLYKKKKLRNIRRKQKNNRLKIKLKKLRRRDFRDKSKKWE